MMPKQLQKKAIMVTAMVVTVVAIGGINAVAGAAGVAASGAIAYPEGYRAWTHVKSMIIEPGHPLENPFAGIHHVYANKSALSGLQHGNYPDGAVLVFDLLAAKQDANAVVEGPRKLIGVMVRDAKKYAATGGWGFEAFAGDSKTERIVNDGGQSCFACHQARKDHAYVFSELRP